MAKVYRPYFPEQDFLLPPSLREWLPEGHLAYFVSDLIDQLDLSQIEQHYEREERGYPPYHPHMMTKVLVYRYCVGVFSSRWRGRGYAPKRNTPVVLANANRAKLSVISTVTNKGQMRWKVFSGALNARLLIGFMKRLDHGRRKRIFLILDNLRVHHSKAVKKWLKENADKIEVFYLPSYSPELNPDELLNADRNSASPNLFLHVRKPL